MIKASQVFKTPIHFFAFGFGTGLSPIMPGTCGTLIGILFYLILGKLALVFYLPIVIILTCIGIWICDLSAKKLGVHDYPGIVWDEIVGYLWTMIAMPFTWYWIIIGFVLFRLFDIWKPWPIHYFDQKVPGGLGIMVDDLIAALYAWITLQFLLIIVLFVTPRP